MMYEKLKHLWDEMVINAEKLQKNDTNIVVNKDRYSVFEKIFLNTYDEIKRSSMAPSVEYLDRHKVAAIIVSSVIKVKFLEYSVDDGDKQFILPYQFALSAGLSYMQYEYNHKLITVGEKPIDCYKFPPTICTNNDYPTNMIKMLYNSDKGNDVDILSMANIFFLIERYTELM